VYIKDGFRHKYKKIKLKKKNSKFAELAAGLFLAYMFIMLIVYLFAAAGR
jgi:hypothetical protein